MKTLRQFIAEAKHPQWRLDFAKSQDIHPSDLPVSESGAEIHIDKIHPTETPQGGGTWENPASKKVRSKINALASVIHNYGEGAVGGELTLYQRPKCGYTHVDGKRVVVPKGKTHVVKDGHHRLAAMRKNGEEWVSANVIKFHPDSFYHKGTPVRNWSDYEAASDKKVSEEVAANAVQGGKTAGLGDENGEPGVDRKRKKKTVMGAVFSRGRPA